jgi:hypothetical protein
MAGDSKDKRGLAKASESTKKKVASEGGKAFHDKRGQYGTDSTGMTGDTDTESTNT